LLEANSHPVKSGQDSIRSIRISCVSKSPPFKNRLKDALEIARQAGYARVRLTTRDGATYDFAVDNTGLPPIDGAVEINEIDAIMQRRRKQRNEAKS
jgi:hypothetical protein